MSLASTDGVPSSSFLAITKSDSTVYSPPPRMVYVGGVGDLAVVDANGVNTVFKAVPTGTTLLIRPSQIMSTNTTATNIVGMF
jgi:hypothetical protein